MITSKFEGTNLDWLRSWSQFETEINRVDITTISKFSYLKELVIPKLSALIDGLPINTEGYERAKTILKANFGKPNQVTNPHIHCILSLPTITQNSAGNIHNFYDFYDFLTNYQQFVHIWPEQTLRKGTGRNLIPLEEKRKLNRTKRERLYQTSQDD